MINCEKKEMIPLANKKNKLYLNQKVCHIFKKEFGTDDKNSETIVSLLVNIEELLMMFAI